MWGTTNRLIRASGRGHLEAVRSALKRDLDVNGRDHEGDTALYCAASAGHVQVVHALLDAGADPNLKPGTSGYPLLIAARTCLSSITRQPIPTGKSSADYMAVVMALLRAGANPAQIYDSSFILMFRSANALSIVQVNQVGDAMWREDLLLAWRDPSVGL